MSSAPDWLLILTGLGGGVLGSIVTTYGTQAKERREARAKARDAVRKVETIAFRGPKNPQELEAALGKFETSAMLARLPQTLIDLHSEARRRRLAVEGELSSGHATDQARREARISGRVADEAAQLLAAASWHPWAAPIYRRRRTRWLRTLLDAAKPQNIREAEKQQAAQNREDEQELIPKERSR